jgi:hypothetical protein
MHYLMRKHICDKIGLKHEETRKKRKAARNGPSQNKNAELLKEMKEIETKREIQLIIIKKSSIRFGNQGMYVTSSGN